MEVKKWFTYIKITLFVSIFIFAFFPLFSAVYSGETVRDVHLEYSNENYTENLYNFVYYSSKPDDVVSFGVEDVTTGLGLTIFIFFIPFSLISNIAELRKIKKQKLLQKATPLTPREIQLAIVSALLYVFFAIVFYTARAELGPVRGLAVGGIKLSEVTYLPAAGAIILGTISIVLSNLTITETILMFVLNKKAKIDNTPTSNSLIDELQKLNELLNANVITVEDFEAIKQSILQKHNIFVSNQITSNQTTQQGDKYVQF